MERTNTHQMCDNDQFRHVRDRHNNTTSQTAGIRLISDEIADPSTINRPQSIKAVINNRIAEPKPAIIPIPVSSDNNSICIINGLDDVGDPNNTNNNNNVKSNIINDNNNSISVRSVDNGVVEFNFCPYCGVATDRISGCNFMDCAIGDRSAMPAEKITESICRGQWCFVCGLAKHPTLPGYEYLKTCINNSHDSHAGSSYTI